jgi:hypothetical protein
MQVHADVARSHRQRGNRLADDSDDLSRVGPELAAHDLARERHGQREQFPLDVGIELFERLREIVKHAGELFDLGAHLRAARFAPLGEALLERFLIGFRL